MATIKSFEELSIWQESQTLTIEIYKQFSTIKDYCFKDQIQRASVSVMNNIAEGFERDSDKEFQHFLKIAKGSAGEVRSMLYLATQLGYCESTKLIEEIRTLSMKNSKLIKYLNK